MSRKTRFITGLTIVAIVFTVGFAIPTIIEGINIGKNVENYSVYDQHIDSKNYTNFSWYVDSAERLYISIISRELSEYNDIPLTFAILERNEFNDWILNDNEAPKITNCTFYQKQAEIDIVNLQLRLDRDYYFVFFNDNSETIQIFVEITLIPWGHITAGGIVAFGFIIFLSLLIGKIALTFVFIKKEEKKKSKVITYHTENRKNDSDEIAAELQPEINTFCVSCGAPVTLKTGRYCPNCGSSITK